MRTGFAASAPVKAQKSLLDIHSDAAIVPGEPLPASGLWPSAPHPIQPIDTTPRVISFVLGFALASLIAWLGSISGHGIVTSQAIAPVVPAAIPVVGSATEEKMSTTLSVPVTATSFPLPTQGATGGAEGKDRGALALSSSPDGAEVVLNGTVVGETPVVLSNLPPGDGNIVVRRQGYAPWSASIRVVANQRTNVQATLSPAGR